MTAGVASAEGFKQGIRNTLIDSDDVYNIVGPAVYGNHAQTDDMSTIEFPHVVIEFYLGDMMPPVGSYQKVIFELWCFHRESSSAALRLYDACFAALQNQYISVTGIGTKGACTEMNRPTEGFYEMPRAYFARGRWLGRALTLS